MPATNKTVAQANLGGLCVNRLAQLIHLLGNDWSQ